ncbi:hypothetical protein ACEQ8H_005922 [Pleosporales sp. CAS-2024a]
MAVISFGGHDSILVDGEALGDWLPNLSPYSLSIDGEYLVDEMELAMSAYTRSGISTCTIRTVLKTFFDAFRPRRFVSRTDHIAKTLESLIQVDLHRGSLWGLEGSRPAFLVLASLARITASDRLGQALVTFLSAFVFLVAQHETRHVLREWAMALDELRGLVYESTLQQLVEYLVPSLAPLYDPWRGRRWPGIWRGQAGGNRRTKSAPGHQRSRPHSPDRPPRMNPHLGRRPGRPSAAPEARTPPYRGKNEYSKLELEQDMQALQVREMKERLDEMKKH